MNFLAPCNKTATKANICFYGSFFLYLFGGLSCPSWNGFGLWPKSILPCGLRCSVLGWVWPPLVFVDLCCSCLLLADFSVIPRLLNPLSAAVKATFQISNNIASVTKARIPQVRYLFFLLENQLSNELLCSIGCY